MNTTLRKNFDYKLADDSEEPSNPTVIEVKTFAFYKAELKKLSEEEEIDDKESGKIISCIITLYCYDVVVGQINKIKHFKGGDAIIGEFYEDIKNGKVYFICNNNMGEINWYNANDGSLVEYNADEDDDEEYEDKFIINEMELIVEYKRIENYLYILYYGYFGDGDYTQILDLHTREIHYIEHISQRKKNKFDLYECSSILEFLQNKDEIFKQREYNFRKALFNSNRTSKNTLLRIFLENPDTNFIGDSKAQFQNLLDNDAVEFTCTCFSIIKSETGISKERKERYDRCLYEVINVQNEKKIVGLYRETFVENESLNYLVPKVLFGTFFRRLLGNGVIELHFSITTECNNIEIDILQNLMPDGDRYQEDPAEKCNITIRSI